MTDERKEGSCPGELDEDDISYREKLEAVKAVVEAHQEAMGKFNSCQNMRIIDLPASGLGVIKDLRKLPSRSYSSLDADAPRDSKPRMMAIYFRKTTSRDEPCSLDVDEDSKKLPSRDDSSLDVDDPDCCSDEDMEV